MCVCVCVCMRACVLYLQPRNFVSDFQEILQQPYAFQFPKTRDKKTAERRHRQLIKGPQALHGVRLSKNTNFHSRQSASRI